MNIQTLQSDLPLPEKYNITENYPNLQWHETIPIYQPPNLVEKKNPKIYLYT